MTPHCGLSSVFDHISICAKDDDNTGDEEFCGRRSTHLEQSASCPSNRNALASDVRPTSQEATCLIDWQRLWGLFRTRFTNLRIIIIIIICPTMQCISLAISPRCHLSVTAHGLLVCLCTFRCQLTMLLACVGCSVQGENTAAWKCLRRNVCQTKWFWWSLLCTVACGPAAVRSESTALSAAAPAWWLSSTADARDVAAVASSFLIATCMPSAAVPSRPRRISKRPTRAYRVSVTNINYYYAFIPNNRRQRQYVLRWSVRPSGRCFAWHECQTFRILTFS